MAVRGEPIPVAGSAAAVRQAYGKFDMLRVRSEPFDEGDMQNIHLWMCAVTEWIERQGSQARGEGG